MAPPPTAFGAVRCGANRIGVTRVLLSSASAQSCVKTAWLRSLGYPQARKGVVRTAPGALGGCFGQSRPLLHAAKARTPWSHGGEYPARAAPRPTPSAGDCVRSPWPPTASPTSLAAAKDQETSWAPRCGGHRPVRPAARNPRGRAIRTSVAVHFQAVPLVSGMVVKADRAYRRCFRWDSSAAPRGNEKIYARVRSGARHLGS